MATRRDRRLVGLLLTAAAVLAGGAWIDHQAGTPDVEAVAAPRPVPHADEVRRRFESAVVMLHARQYEHAATALHEVLRLAPTLTEAHVNMGFALLGLQRPAAARSFFEGATALNPAQANAYYGLALASEAEGDYAMATGAMRSYLHLARDERPEHLARARAALWEWQRHRPEAASAPAPR